MSCDNIDKKSIHDENLKVINKFIANNPEIIDSKEPLNHEYLDTDIEIIEKIINKIPYLKPTISEFEKYCPGFEGWEYPPPQQMGQIDLGFGLTKSSDVFYGGYGSFYLEIVHYKNNILYLELLMSFTSQNQLFIKENIINKIDFPIMCYDDNSIIYKKSFEENISNFKILINEDLSKDYSEKEIEMYKQLTNPTKWHFYDCGNRGCGCGGGEPYTDKGRIAVDSLSKMKSYDLIEKAVYCPNPVGRIYALEKLEKLERNQKIEIEDSTKLIIDSIKNLDIKIDLCNWCPIESYLGQFSYKEVKLKLDSVNCIFRSKLTPYSGRI